MAMATFGAGCFWGVEATFREVKGVTETAVGYAGGTTENPTYEDVCQGNTGHAEVVQLTFDPTQVTYQELLATFWQIHDSTTLNRQGPDIGTQYRSVVFYQPTCCRERNLQKPPAAIVSLDGRYLRLLDKKKCSRSFRFRRPI